MKTVTTRLLATAASGAALALTLSAGTASASVPVNGPTGMQAVSHLTDVPIGGGNGDWANAVSFGRNLTVTSEGNVDSSFCNGDFPCQEFSATYYDGELGSLNSNTLGGQPRFNRAPGGFVTIPGAFAPNQTGANAGSTIQRTAIGSFSGEVHYASFYTASVAGPLGKRVPTQVSSYPSVQWPALEWPAGTTFYGLFPTFTSYQFRTTVSHQTWVASSVNNNGQSIFAGNITG